MFVEHAFPFVKEILRSERYLVNCLDKRMNKLATEEEKAAGQNARLSNERVRQQKRRSKFGSKGNGAEALPVTVEAAEEEEDAPSCSIECHHKGLSFHEDLLIWAVIVGDLEFSETLWAQCASEPDGDPIRLALLAAQVRPDGLLMTS